ncbi:MAG: class I SAM-dependent methyltransferase [Erythrobacter sp.]
MALQDIIARARGRLRKLAGKSYLPYFAFTAQELDPAEATQLRTDASNDLERLIYGHNGRIVHKWLHYPEIYEREFARYRGTDVNFLEIGIFKGGSIEIWRKYFGEEARIAGLDIEPHCADYVEAPNRAFIGSQADPAFLESVIHDIGAPDIILDDGSHVAEHQEVTFKTLFPHLKTGGLYVIEDLHTAYWPGFYQGGYRRKGTAIELAKALIDDMHAWYHHKGSQYAGRTTIKSVRFYDSIVVIEKGDIAMPQHIKVSGRDRPGL